MLLVSKQGLQKTRKFAFCSVCLTMIRFEMPKMKIHKLKCADAAWLEFDALDHDVFDYLRQEYHDVIK